MKPEHEAYAKKHLVVVREEEGHCIFVKATPGQHVGETEFHALVLSLLTGLQVSWDHNSRNEVAFSIGQRHKIAGAVRDRLEGMVLEARRLRERAVALDADCIALRDEYTELGVI